jgi:hypothetical protein
MERSYECRLEGTLIACPKEPVLYIVTGIFLILAVFYAYRLFVVIKQSFSVSFKVLWPSFLFWICVLINPAIEFIHYLALNLWVTTVEKYIFLILMPFSENFPYISITIIVLKFEQSFLSSSGKKEKLTYWALAAFSFFFILETILFFAFLKSVMLYFIIDVINVITYIIAITTFFFVCISTIDEIYSMNITAFPINFFKNLIIGFNIVTICNLFYVIIRSFFYIYVSFSGITAKHLSLKKHDFFMGCQMLCEVVGVAVPHFVISIGILYLNSISKDAITNDM